MRGEVVLCSRNVRVVGNDTDNWGAQIVVADSLELSGAMRTGQLILDNVECERCSQRNTQSAAVRIDYAKTLHQQLTGFVAWGGYAWGLNIQDSKNVLVQDSFFISGRQIGVHISKSNNVTIDRVVVADYMTRPEAYGHHIADKEACYAICSFLEGDPQCFDIKVTNSIAAGCVFAGFVAPGHDCGASDS